MSDKADKLELADAIDINKIMRQATRAAEKQAELSPVFLKRDSFAGSAVSTGSLCVDKMMGGGIPACRIVGISGPERAGKTLFGTQIGYNQVKNRDGFFVLLDAEGSTDPIFLAARGIDYELYKGRRNKSGDLLPEEVDYVYLYQPSTVEQIVNYIHTISASLPENRNPKRPVCIYSLDSVVALITNEIDGNLDANKMTMHARSYATYLPVINSDLVKSGSSMIYMNQLRQRPGVAYGPSSYEPAGDALKFFSSIRLMLSTTKPKEGDKDHPFLTKEMIPGVEVKEGGVWEEPHLDSSGNVIGMDRYIYTGVKTVKNKVFTPYQKCWVRIQFEENGATGHGLDPVFDVFNFLSDAGYIVPQVKEGKKRSLKGVYATKKCDQFNPVEELDMPSSFDYYEFKSWVKGKSNLVSLIRDKLLVSGIVYTKEEKDTFELIKKESEEELEALADCEDMDEAEDAVEEVEKKKRGRKPKSS